MITFSGKLSVRRWYFEVWRTYHGSLICVHAANTDMLTKAVTALLSADSLIRPLR